MKIIEQTHTILSLPNNVLEMVENSGRTCYKSENKIGCTKDACTKPEFNYDFQDDNDSWGCDSRCPNHSSQKFVKRLIDRGHHAMVEFGDIIVRFVTNRGVTHELVRHRLCSFAQESTRYVNYKGGMEFIRPVWCSEKILGDYNHRPTITDIPLQPELHWAVACHNAMMSYATMIHQGWRPEQAREVLPNSLKTEIVMKCNMREMRHILDLRCSKRAHPQIRALMLPLLKELKENVPVLFDDLYPGE